MKKYTPNGFVHVIETESIEYFNLTRILVPKVKRFKVEIESESEPFIVPHGTDTPISVESWLHLLLNQKVVTPIEFRTDDENLISVLSNLTGNIDPFLYVKSIDEDYLLQTIFTILSQILPLGSTLKSIQYIS